METKTCSKCSRELPMTSEFFHKHKLHADGFHSMCKECRGSKKKSTIGGFKICSICNIEKPLDSFNNQAAGYLGKRSYCRECQNKSHSDYRKSEHGKKVRSAWKKTEKGRENVKRYKLNPTTIKKVREYHRSDGYRTKRRARVDVDRFGGNRLAVLERDNHRCTMCGSDYRLQVHHKDEMGRNKPREVQNNDINNLITLCAKCHIKQHNPVLKRWAAK